jgi:hypothetical protein
MQMGLQIASHKLGASDGEQKSLQNGPNKYGMMRDKSFAARCGKSCPFS